jgi:DNA-binding NarL/FixJ family response regulator
VEVTALKQTERDLRAAREQVAEELRRMTRLHDLSASLQGSGGLDTMLDNVIRAAVDMTGAAMGDIQHVDEGGRPDDCGANRVRSSVSGLLRTRGQPQWQPLRESAPTLPVLVLSMHDEALFAERVLRAGARGYIMKREAITGLVGAIRQVLSGRIYVSEDMAQSVLERLGHDGAAPDNPLAKLTDRELEVFDLIGRGLSTTAIAEQLTVSVKTIETYRSNIKTKLNLRDATDLIRFAATWTERLSLLGCSARFEG